MSLNMGHIKREHRELFALEFGKIRASTNTDQSAPNLVKMYLTIKSQMSLIMNVIKPELSELFALAFAKIAESDCLYPSIYKCRPISTNYGHNIINEILDEFDYRSNPTVTSGVICP